MDLLSGSPVCLLILTDPVVLSRVGRVVFFLDFHLSPFLLGVGVC